MQDIIQNCFFLLTFIIKNIKNVKKRFYVYDFTAGYLPPLWWMYQENSNGVA